MKKTLIALTLATLPVAAMADVVLYGQIKAGYQVANVKASGENKDNTDNVNGIADYGSRIGFKGSEDLGNGLKAIWQVESKTSIAGTDKGWSTRDSFIGLEGGFGKVRTGNLSNQLNDMGVIDTWEYNGGTVAGQALGLSKFTRTGERWASVRYDSPEFAGFSGNVQYGARDNYDSTAMTGGKRSDMDGARYGLGLNYSNSGFFAHYGYALLKNKAAYDYDAQVHRVEGGYDANNLFVGLGYQNAKNYDGPVKQNELALTAGYHFGNVFPKISYAHGWNQKSTLPGGKTEENTKYDQIVLGADYDFSKRTTAMVSAGWLKQGEGKDANNNNVSTRATALGVGLKHKF